MRNYLRNKAKIRWDGDLGHQSVLFRELHHMLGAKMHRRHFASGFFYVSLLSKLLPIYSC